MVYRLIAIGINLLGLLRRDDANLIVLATVLPGCIVHWVDVQLGSGRLPGLLPQALHELLLEIIGDVVLLAEENNASL